MNNDGISANTILHYHANIHKALAYAVKTERIPTNPADKVELPKKQKHIANYYTQGELNTLLKNSKGHLLETVIRLAVWFGLRRGEIIGMRWSSIDFDNKTISDALEKLKVKEKIVAEKERICDELFGDYFNALAANRAVKRAKQELSGTDTIN